MGDIRMLFDRQLSALAYYLECELSHNELGDYIKELGHYGLRNLAEACLEFQERGYKKGKFPTIAEFDTLLKSYI